MKITTALEPDVTQALTYLRGEFAIWKYSIPYFSTIVPLRFASEKFTLIDEIVDVEMADWSLEELFQREIDWNRVQTEIVKFLRNENRPQFFNALTVALLPKEGRSLLRSYADTTPLLPLTDEGLDAPVQVGGIQIQAFQGADAGKIRWDLNAVTAIAVDGQHRLASIKEFAKYATDKQLTGTTIPVIFLVPHESVGFVEPSRSAGSESSIMTTLRRIFIDLNKHARSVSRARTILLDDTDITAVCTRALIGSTLTRNPNEEDQLPLAIVDWISEVNKVETGPFLTTVLILHDVVAGIVNTPNTNEVQDEDAKVQRWLEDTFEPTDEQLEELMSQVQRCYLQEVPLTFRADELSILKELFIEKWRPHIYRVLSELTPYQELISYGEKNGLHSPQFVDLYAAEEVFEGEKAQEKAESLKKSYKAKNSEWNFNKDYQEHLSELEKIKEGHWAFKVVFQKASLLSFVSLFSQHELFVSEEELEEDARSIFTDRWIEAVNMLFTAGLGSLDAKFGSPKEPFWAGIGLKADGTIDFTATGAKRISSWLNVWVCLYWLDDDAPRFDSVKDADDELCSIIDNSFNRYKFVLQGLERVAIARSDLSDEDQIKEEGVKLARKRYNYFSKLISDLS